MTINVGEKELLITSIGDKMGTYDAGDGTYVCCKRGLAVSDYKDYLSCLKNQGYTVAAEYELGGNLYALLKGEDITVYVSLLKDAYELRVYAEPAGFADYPEVSAPVECDGEVTVFQLEVDSRGTRQNGGMTYIIKLANGNFLIMDGGYYTDVEADRIYQVLRDNTPEGRVPHIEAWFLTHMHGDHYGGMIRYAEKYASVSELDAYYHAGQKCAGGLWNGMVEKFFVLRDFWEKKPRVFGKLHTGMTFEFAGVSVKVMCTHEDVFPKTFIDGNDTSTTYRFDIAGQRLFFLGDCRDHECDAMMKAFARSGELKCDIVQWSHHGYEGATREFYETVDAPTILFPLNIVGWQENYTLVPQNVFNLWFFTENRPCGRYIHENLANGKIKKVIVAGAGEQSITFPYYPEGEVILDQWAFFEENKHDVPEGYELKGYRYLDNGKIEKI